MSKLIDLTDNSHEVFAEFLDLYKELREDDDKKKISNNKLHELVIFLRELKALDMGLANTIKDSSLCGRTDSIYEANEFPQHMNNISEDEVIIYVQNAKLYKTYNPKEIKKYLVSEMSTVFAKPKTGPVYEVVRDDFPRKLVFVASDLEETQIMQMRGHILDFLRMNETLKHLKETDCMIYKSGNDVRYVFNSVKLANYMEWIYLIGDFYRFLQKKTNTEMTKKLQTQAPPGEVRGASLHPLPGNMIPVGLPTTTQAWDDMPKYLMTSQNTEKTVVFNVNIKNINSNNVNSTVSSHNTTNNETTNVVNKSKIKVTTVSDDQVRQFLSHVYNDKPTWYKEGKNVDINVITTAFNDYLNCGATSSVVSRRLANKLFGSSERANGKTTKKLVTRAALRTHIME